MSKTTPTLTRQALLFVDLLGFREAMISTASDLTKANKLLADYVRVVGNTITSQLNPPHLQEHRHIIRYNYRGFTDNFLVSIAIDEDDIDRGETALAILTTMASDLQYSLAAKGWFIRGSIVVGNLYIDDRIVFGPALIEAYTLESQYARDPRIILGKDALELTYLHTEFYRSPHDSPQNSMILIDSDGWPFINYLYNTISDITEDDDPEDSIIKVLSPHREQVIEKLRKYRSKPLVWAKYRWVAAYHNHVCSKIRSQHLPEHSLKEIKIPSKSFNTPSFPLISTKKKVNSR